MEDFNFGRTIFAKSANEYLAIEPFSILGLVSKSITPALDNIIEVDSGRRFPIANRKLTVKFPNPICRTSVIKFAVVEGLFGFDRFKLVLLFPFQHFVYRVLSWEGERLKRDVLPVQVRLNPTMSQGPIVGRFGSDLFP